MVLNDDVSIIFNLKKLESDASYIVLTVECENLDATANVMNDLQYSRVRLSDHKTNQTLDSTNLLNHHRFDEMKNQDADGDLNQGARIFSYYMYKMPEFGWMAESLN
mmetsp:Transcript_24105/g.21172  ORF Transcript_24105/g.21172 Transcript_24105/m.21172 type:complete len:107 (-) Transcript_24105:683-1003(-)